VAVGKAEVRMTIAVDWCPISACFGGHGGLTKVGMPGATLGLQPA